MANSPKKSRKSPEPDTSPAKGMMDQLGTLAVAGLGCLFVAYVLNFEGTKTALDGALGGLDHTARSHGSEVSRYVVLAFPYVAGALALAFVRILGGALLIAFLGLFRGKKKKAKAKPEVHASTATTLTQMQAPAALPVKVAAMAAGPVAVAKPPAVCIKPPKPLRPERGVATVTPGRA